MLLRNGLKTGTPRAEGHRPISSSRSKSWSRWIQRHWSHHVDSSSLLDFSNRLRTNEKMIFSYFSRSLPRSRSNSRLHATWSPDVDISDFLNFSNRSKTKEKGLSNCFHWNFQQLDFLYDIVAKQYQIEQNCKVLVYSPWQDLFICEIWLWYL